MKRALLIIVSFMLTGLTGCVATSVNPNISMETVSLLEDEVQIITDDLLAVLSDRFGPGQTTFQFQPPSQSSLGAALESGLRDKGYAVSRDGGLPLTYIVDTLGVRQIVVRILAGDDFQAARVYARSYDGFGSQTAFTVRN